MLAGNDETERGAVFARPDVVAAILDLSGYIATQALHRMRRLEPSFGGGEFLLAAVDRLLAACRHAGGKLGHDGQVIDEVQLRGAAGPTEQCRWSTATSVRSPVCGRHGRGVRRRRCRDTSDRHY
ncbi:MAG: hypothetical protein IPO66_12075 [Rhodanobacteraceae bacterium]|nr:hypothetical protein [Rhodanobacteraceae bacterium]